MCTLATEAEPHSSVLLSRQMIPLLCLLQSHVFPIHTLFTHATTYWKFCTACILEMGDADRSLGVFFFFCTWLFVLSRNFKELKVRGMLAVNSSIVRTMITLIQKNWERKVKKNTTVTNI